jgi:7-carboxy-7-deazaguanine synthase
MKAKISEIFMSIQGEGPYCGRLQVFIRFFGCNISCRFCDTKSDGFTEYTVIELIEQVKKFESCESVSITGGEPLLQSKFLEEFLPLLKSAGKEVYLETNGILYKDLPNIIDYVDVIAMDFKLASSTGEKDYWFAHREFLKIASKKEVFIKAVISETTSIQDINMAIAVINEIKNDVLLVLQPQSPHEQTLDEKLKYLHNICKEHSIRSKIIPQIHKQLGVR